MITAPEPHRLPYQLYIDSPWQPLSPTGYQELARNVCLLPVQLRLPAKEPSNYAAQQL